MQFLLSFRLRLGRNNPLEKKGVEIEGEGIGICLFLNRNSFEEFVEDY